MKTSLQKRLFMLGLNVFLFSSLNSLSQQENLSLMTSVFLKANRSVLLLFLSLSVKTGR